MTTVGRPLYAPLDAVRAAGFRTSLFQGCAYGVDPRNGRGYLFQLQALRDVDGLKGDEEHLRIHRFRLHTDGTPAPLTYEDTMVVRKGGHVQSAHVRISAAGNPYLWLGLERYDGNGRQTGADLYRIRYQPGRAINRSGSDGVQRVYTGEGTAMAVGCPDWTVVVRRPGSLGDTFEWHSERALLGSPVQRSAKNGIRPAPSATVFVPKLTPDDNYQSSLAQGKWNAGPLRIWRATGADTVGLSCSSDDARLPERVDLTDQAWSFLASPAERTPTTEPEGLVTIGDTVHVAVQTGSVARRRIAYFPVTP